MTTLAQLVPAWDSSDRAQFVAAWIAQPPDTLTVDHDIPTGNINPALTVITGATTTTPTVYVKCRTTGVWGACGYLFALDGCNGKTVTVQVDTSNWYGRSVFHSSWDPYYSLDDGETWQSIATFTALTSPARVQFTTPEFAVDRVLLAANPPYTYERYADLAALLQDDTSGRVHPSGSADANGVLGTSPAETDDLGREVGGKTVWGFRLEDESLTADDGGPKRELVLTSGVHGGEVIDGWFLQGALDYWLNGTGDNATRFRRNWRVLAYFPINPNGRFGGNGRGVWRESQDPNRDWDDAPGASLAETNLFRSAIAADAARHDVHIDFHDSSVIANETASVRVSSELDPAQYTAFKAAFDSLDSEPLTVVYTNTAGTVTTWARTQQACRMTVVSEPSDATSRPAARCIEVGAHYVEAVSIMDGDAWFYTPGGVVAGAFASTESGVDTASASGAVLVQADLAATEAGTDTAAFNGSSIITTSGDLAATEAGADTASMSGAVLVEGDFAATETGADTASFVGEGAAAIAAGDLAATETGVDAASVSGVVVVAGMLAGVEAGADTSGISGQVVVQGAAAATEVGNDIALFNGSSIIITSGALDATETGSDTASVSGAVLVQALLDALEAGADTAALSGQIIISGSVAAPETGSDFANFLGEGINLVQGTVAAVESGADAAFILGDMPWRTPSRNRVGASGDASSGPRVGTERM